MVRSQRKVSRSRGKVSRSRRQSKTYRRKRAMSKQARRTRKRTRKRQNLRSKRLSGGMMGEENLDPDVPEVTASPNGPFEADVYVGTFSGKLLGFEFRRWRKAEVKFELRSHGSRGVLSIRYGVLSIRYKDGSTGENVLLYKPQTPSGSAGRHQLSEASEKNGFVFNELKEALPAGFKGYTIKGPTTALARTVKKISFKFDDLDQASEFEKSIGRLLPLQVQSDSA